MLVELFCLVLLTRRIDEICAAKHRAAGGWRVLLVLLWVAGEIAGLILGAIFTLAKPGAPDIYVAATIYIAALIGAALGAVLCFWVVNDLAAKTE
jgi:hypothetical protein